MTGSEKKRFLDLLTATFDVDDIRQLLEFKTKSRLCALLRFAKRLNGCGNAP